MWLLFASGYETIPSGDEDLLFIVGECKGYFIM